MRITNIYASAIALLAVAGPSLAAPETSICQSDENVPAAVSQALDSVLMSLADPDADTSPVFGYAPGGVLSLKGADWRYARAIGNTAIEGGKPITCDMPFQIGSNTKMMTAAVLMQLVEEGALSLDDALSAHLPDIAKQLPNGEAMTLRHLAMHTSGVFSYTDNAPDGTPGIMEGDLTDANALRRGYTPDQLVEWVIAHGQPTFAPGEDSAWAYSNTGYILLGMIIEKIEGRTLGESFKARIFVPLGMNKTLMWNDVPSGDLGLPHAYFKPPFDTETTDWNMSQAWAAGAVISTADDMHVFIEALANGRLFKSQDTLAAMQQTVPTGNPTLQGYGIGLADKGSGAWGHGGQTLGFESDVAHFTQAGVSFVGWGNSASNILAAGVSAVSGALVEGGILPDPTIALSDELHRAMASSEWQLVAIKVDDKPETVPDDPTSNTVTFSKDGRLSAKADCNRVQGDWSVENLKVKVTLGPATMALCPPGSLGDTFRDWLGAAVSAYIAENELTVVSVRGTQAASLKFRALK